MKDRRGGREGLRWGDINFETGVVRLEESKTGAQLRVIGEAALGLLRAALPERAGDDDLVCPGSRPGQPFIGIDKARLRVYEAAGLAELPGVDLHSLRHTFACVGAYVQNGRFAAFVGPLLGHGYQQRSITERYVQSNPQALRSAADAIAGSIANSLGLAEPARVLAFTG
jgi:integrase